MNCIATSKMRALLVCVALCGACGTQVADSEEPADPLAYRLTLVVEPRPLDGIVDVTLRLHPNPDGANSSDARRLLALLAGRLPGPDSGWRRPEACSP